MNALTYPQFPGVVCQRMRNLRSSLKAVEAERKEAFTERNQAKKRLDELGDDPSEERDRLLRTYADKVIKLDRLQTSIDWHNDEIGRSIDQGDEPGLFETADVAAPKHQPKPKEEPKSAAPPTPAGAPAEPVLELKFPATYVIVAHHDGVQGGTFVCNDRSEMRKAIEQCCRTDRVTMDDFTGLVYQGREHLCTVMNAKEEPAPKGGKKKGGAK